MIWLIDYPRIIPPRQQFIKPQNFYTTFAKTVGSIITKELLMQIIHSKQFYFTPNGKNLSITEVNMGFS